MHVLEADVSEGPRASLVLPPDVHSLTLLRGLGVDDETRGAMRLPLLVVCDEPSPSLPDFFSAGLASVASSRTLHLFATLGVDNVEVLDARIESNDGELPDAGHYALNVIGRVACIDLGRSEYTTFDGELFKLETMVLRDGIPADLMMFRPEEWPLVILVRDEVAEALRGAGLTGLRLTPVADWVNQDF